MMTTKESQLSKKHKMTEAAQAVQATQVPVDDEVIMNQKDTDSIHNASQRQKKSGRETPP